MSHWTDELSDDNPVLWVYHYLQENPGELRALATRLGHPIPADADLDDMSYEQVARTLEGLGACRICGRPVNGVTICRYCDRMMQSLTSANSGYE